jgi:hypothetical protein
LIVLSLVRGIYDAGGGELGPGTFVGSLLTKTMSIVNFIADKACGISSKTLPEKAADGALVFQALRRVAQVLIKVPIVPPIIKIGARIVEKFTGSAVVGFRFGF